MDVVRTVLGDVDPHTLGRVMPHEHLQSLVPGPWLTGGTRDDAVTVAAGALAGLRAAGFDTVVDLSPYGVVGRDPDAAGLGGLREIARLAQVAIVAGTAVYLEPYSPRWARQASLREMTDRFIRDATTGIGASDVRAGILGEQATGLGHITEHEDKCLRAAARASRETGLALMTHTTHATMGPQQVDIVRQEGADLSRVAIGHMDIAPGLDDALRLLDAGVSIAFDTIGKQYWDFVLEPLPPHLPPGEFAKRAYYRPDAARADALAQLVARGYAGQLLLSQDLTGAEVYLNPATHGQCSYSYLARTFLPMLRERGVGEPAIQTMTRTNPLRLLTIHQ